MASDSKTAVLLLAHGSPERVDDIPQFLLNITEGRPLPEAVVKEVQHRYSLIGRSPLTEISIKQAEGVAKESGIPTYLGMRNWYPLIGDTIQRMASDGVKKAIAICLAPQNSRTSVGLYRKSLDGAPFEIDFVDNWHDNHLLIRAFGERLRTGWLRACEQAGARLPVIFTAHSVPQRTISEGDPYEDQATETAALVAEDFPELRTEEWSFAFQSQGMSGGTWLGPTVEETILRLKGKGHKGVFLQPIGFVCDHVEILYDIDIAFKKFAEDNDMKLWRAESLNDSPNFIAAIADVAKERLKLSVETASARKL